MKQHLENLIKQAIEKLQDTNKLPQQMATIQLETNRDKKHGDFSSNIAFLLASSTQKNPRQLAEVIVAHLPPSHLVEKVEIAGPGFINFFLSSSALEDVLSGILQKKEKYGCSKMGRGKKIILEFVSSNPTGPLHVGHGRHAVLGDVMAKLLAAIGFNTYCEYYVNDDGRQMDIITVSVWIRYLNLCGEQLKFPQNGYQGNYVIAIAKALHQTYQRDFIIPVQQGCKDLLSAESTGRDHEADMDALIEQAKQLLGDKYKTIFHQTLNRILTDIRADLTEFGVHFDNWFSAKEFARSDFMADFINQLIKSGHAYEKAEAIWFKSTAFGDEKDRVLIRKNGKRTYFANDFAYHINKFLRGFDLAIDILGSDHHGFIPRLRAGVYAYGINPERLMFLLLQLVTLYRGGRKVQMSTRSGNFVTLRELREEVGNDAARFFYMMRKSEQAMDFDLDLAKTKSNENPVYYVQYAHARICSVMRQLPARHWHYDEQQGLANNHLLTSMQERQLLNTLSHYSDVIVDAALQYEPHKLTHYLRELAGDFHAYYNSQQFLVDDAPLRNARLALIAATKQILVNGFNLLGISAPRAM